MATVTATAPSPSRVAPRFWLKPAALTAIIGGLYGPVLADMAHDWWTEPRLSYGLLIPPLSVYVAWTWRATTLAVPIRPDNRGLSLTAAASFMYIVGVLGAEFFLPRMSFVLLLAGLVWTFWGSARLRSLALPFLLLATMVPLPAIVNNAMAAPLQLFASDVASRIAEAFGVSVFRDGNILHLAQITLGVEEACSGLSSLSALIVGSVLCGFLLLKRPLSRWGLFLLSLPLAVAVNVFRVALTAILADVHEEFALGFYHAFSGWLVFVLGSGCQYGVALLLRGILERGKA